MCVISPLPPLWCVSSQLLQKVNDAKAENAILTEVLQSQKVPFHPRNTHGIIPSCRSSAIALSTYPCRCSNKSMGRASLASSVQSRRLMRMQLESEVQPSKQLRRQRNLPRRRRGGSAWVPHVPLLEGTPLY